MTEPHFAPINITTKRFSTAVETAMSTALGVPNKVDKGTLSFNVMDYGALGTWNGTSGSNDTAGIDAAIAAWTAAGGGEIFFPARPAGQGYRYLGTLPTTSGITYRGTNRERTKVSVIGFDAFAVPSGTSKSVNISGLWIAVSGGHFLNITAGAHCYYWRLSDAMISINSNDKSIVFSRGLTNYLENYWENCDLYRPTASTVPGVDIINSFGGANANVFKRLRVNSQNCTSTPFFRIEADTTGTYAYDNTFEDIVGEQNAGGLIHLYSNAGAHIRNCYDWDTSVTYTDHIIKIDKSSTSTTESRAITISNSGRRGGTLGSGIKDCYVSPNTRGITLTNVGNSSPTPVVQLPQKGATVSDETGLRVAAADVIQPGRNTTANRPSASSAGVGALWHDTDLGRTIVSDGSAWQDPIGGRVEENVLIFNSKKLSVKGDRLAVYTGAVTSGSATLTISTSGVTFTAGDVGKAVTVAGAGAAGATLRTTIAAYVSSTSVTLAATASTTVSGKYTVWGTDDTAAIQAALTAMMTSSGNPLRGGELLIAKNARCMITDSIDLLRATGAIKGAGFCDWNAGFNAASMGSMLFWDGPAGSPMFLVQGTKFFRFENLGIIGNPIADCRPSALFQFNVPDSATTNGQITIENCVIGRYGGYGGFAGGNAERVADIGILMDGVNANNDRFRIIGGRVEGCTTGLSCPNSQSTLGVSESTTFFENDTHISTAASLQLRSIYLGKAAVRDLDILSSARVTLRDVGSEISAQFARMRGQSKLIVDGGYFNLTSSLNGDHVVIDAVDNTRQTIRLKDLLLGSSTGWTVTTAPVLIKAHAASDSSLSNKIIELDNVQYPNATNIGVTPSWFDVTPVGPLESVIVYGNVQPAGGGNQNEGIQQFFHNLLIGTSATLDFTRDDRIAAVSGDIPASDLPTGTVAETFERRQPLTASAGTSGRLVMSAIYLRAGQTVSSITFGSGSTALATGTHGWAALFSPARALLGQSADDTGITWAANAKKTFTLASPVSITSDGWYYVGYCIAASTMPTVQCLANNVFSTDAPAVGGWSTSSLTTTAPNPAAALSAAPYPYAYVS